MTLRWAGAAMTLGGLLFILRIGPVVSKKPPELAFPPENTEGLVELAIAAGGAWPFAHILGLVAAVLMTFGYWRHGEVLASAGHRSVARAAAVVAAIAFGLFCLALVVDGFLVYSAALQSAAEPGDPDLLNRVASKHELALAFFTPALFLMFVAMAVLSSRMLHGFVHSRWLGVLGQIIAILAIVAYLSGLAGPTWNNMQVGGSAIMLGFVWHILVGIAALFGRGLRSAAPE